jgi:hypothetical protein
MLQIRPASSDPEAYDKSLMSLQKVPKCGKPLINCPRLFLNISATINVNVSHIEGIMQIAGRVVSSGI